MSQCASWLSVNAAGANSEQAIPPPPGPPPPPAPASDGKCMGIDGKQCDFGYYSDCNYWKDNGYADYWCKTIDNNWDKCDASDVDCPF